MGYSEYDYGSSATDEYTYSSSMLRQSMSSNHGAESFRPYTTGPLSAPATSSSMYYESGTPFGFGNLQGAPYTAAPASRLSSTAVEALSPLNMASMHSSLPSQTVQERRLPVPYIQAYQQRASTPEVPHIRPLGSFNETRAHINGIHSRTGMPWSMDNSRNDSINTLQNSQAQSVSTSGDMGSAYSNSNDPAFGYQFRASSKSPAVSPTTNSSISDNYQTANAGYKSTPLMMMPPASTKRSSRTGTTRLSLPSLGGADDYRRSSSSREAATSLYSFSTGVDTESTTSTDRHHYLRHTNSNDDFKMAPPNDQQKRFSSPRQSQPQHSASVDELRRRSSLDQQQQQRAATAHRMSVPNLNARY
jgi:hypothetical protein